MCSDAGLVERRRRPRRPALLVAFALLAAWPAVRAAGPRFLPDDPIAQDDDTAFDASGAKSFDLGNYANLVENEFLSPGDRSPIHAVNVNTLEEVPDSSWFTNRIGVRPMSLEEIVRGPDRTAGLSIEHWEIVGGKSTGFQPGFRAVDPAKPAQLYQVEFDPPGNPEMATGAETIGTALYHAFGYNVVDVYLADLDPANVTISPKATINDLLTGRRPFVRADLDALLKKSARLQNGHYRVLVSPFAEGKSMGQFRYYGTRPDDPNDIYPHEHRRELRANRVFGAWIDHDDSRANNTLDMLIGPEGHKYIKHYMFDFGSVLGSGTQFPNDPQSGHEYFIERRPALWTMMTLGLYVRPWLFIDYPKAPAAVGRFEADAFDPPKWKPEYPNSSFVNMQPADAFWGARIVAAFSDEEIRAVVGKARYSDPAAAEFLTAALIKRRDKIAAAWLNGVNPVVDPKLAADGTLTFRNAAVEAHAATPAASYSLAWSRFDNATDTHTSVGTPATVTDTRGAAPAELLTGSDYVAVTITGTHPEHPRWSDPLRIYFKRDGDGWKTVGLERK